LQTAIHGIGDPAKRMYYPVTQSCISSFPVIVYKNINGIRTTEFTETFDCETVIRHKRE
jgi:hypothetical protein